MKTKKGLRTVKRSLINLEMAWAERQLAEHGIHLHGNVGRDWTDFGDPTGQGRLILFNTISQPVRHRGKGQLGYWRKIMVATAGIVPRHTHPSPDGGRTLAKTETIAVLAGKLRITLWGAHKNLTIDPAKGVDVVIDNDQRHPVHVRAGGSLILKPGQQITLQPGDYHEFTAIVKGADECCILEEISTWNDDQRGNKFAADVQVDRFARDIEDDEAPRFWLVSDPLPMRRNLIRRFGKDNCPPLRQGIVL